MKIATILQKPGRAGIAAIILLWTSFGVVHGSILDQPFAPGDDQAFILENPQIARAAEASPADLLLQPGIGYVVPVTGGFEAILYAVGAGQPRIFHLASLLLHGLAAALLFLLMRALGIRVWLAGLATGLHGLHPVCVEAIAWATGIKDLLMACFVLASSLLLVRLVDKPGASRRPGTWLGVAALGIAATLSKPTGSLLAVAWAGFLLSSRSLGKAPGRHAWQTTMVVLLISGAITAMSMFMHDMLRGSDKIPFLGWGVVPQAAGWQVRHLFWPVGLHPRYPDLAAAAWSDPHTWLGLVTLLGLLVLAWRTRRHPPVILGLGIAAATYLPVSNIVPFARVLADSYLYVPLAAMLLAGASLIERWLARKPRLSFPTAVCGLGLCACLLPVTSAQVSRWQDAIGLWYPAAAEYGDWPYAWFQMADGLMMHGKPEQALHVWQQLYARSYVRDYLPQVAETYARLDQPDQAECVLIEDLHWGRDRDRAWRNLARLYLRNAQLVPVRPDLAAAALRRLLAGQPGSDLAVRVNTRLAHIGPVADGQPDSKRWPLRSCKCLQAQIIPGPPLP